MTDSATDKVFAGSIPKIYQDYVVPLIFEPYAKDVARRVALRPVQRVLEIAEEEACQFQHNYIGQEHLLLGLVREADGVAGKILAEFGGEVKDPVVGLTADLAKVFS